MENLFERSASAIEAAFRVRNEARAQRAQARQRLPILEELKSGAVSGELRLVFVCSDWKWLTGTLLF
jgi:hypothetical protein